MFFYTVFTPISTTSGLWSTGSTRKYHQIDVYIYQCDNCYTLHYFLSLLNQTQASLTFLRVPPNRSIYHSCLAFVFISSTWLNAIVLGIIILIETITENSRDMKVVLAMSGSRWGGTSGPHPPPWKITKIQGSLTMLVRIPWKITNLPSQHSMLGHHRHASETPF